MREHLLPSLRVALLAVSLLLINSAGGFSQVAITVGSNGNTRIDSPTSLGRIQKETDTQQARAMLGNSQTNPSTESTVYKAQQLLPEGEILLEQNQEIEALAKWRENQELNLAITDHDEKDPDQNKSKLSTSYGSMLVATLSKKLKGKIDITQEVGYYTTIRFQRHEN